MNWKDTRLKWIPENYENVRYAFIKYYCCTVDNIVYVPSVHSCTYILKKILYFAYPLLNV